MIVGLVVVAAKAMVSAPAVEALAAAVQRVGAVVLRELVCPAVDGETSAGDAVGVAADGDAEVILRRFVLRGRVVAEDDVSEFPSAVGHDERLQRGAVSQHARGNAAAIAELDGLDPGAVAQGAGIDTLRGDVLRRRRSSGRGQHRQTAGDPLRHDFHPF